MGRRTPRIEIKIVDELGTIEYVHRKGDPLSDGGVSEGPTPEDFGIAKKTVLDLIGITKQVEEQLKEQQR